MSDEVRIPFTMQAKVVRGGAPPEPISNPLPPGWARFPARVDAMLSVALVDHLLYDGPVPGPGKDVTLAASSLRLDLDHAQLGDLTPQEMAPHHDLQEFASTARTNPPNEHQNGFGHPEALASRGDPDVLDRGQF